MFSARRSRRLLAASETTHSTFRRAHCRHGDLPSQRSLRLRQKLHAAGERRCDESASNGPQPLWVLEMMRPGEDEGFIDRGDTGGSAGLRLVCICALSCSMDAPIYGVICAVAANGDVLNTGGWVLTLMVLLAALLVLAVALGVSWNGV